jgi:hypothetical protein
VTTVLILAPRWLQLQPRRLNGWRRLGEASRASRSAQRLVEHSRCTACRSLSTEQAQIGTCSQGFSGGSTGVVARAATVCCVAPGGNSQHSSLLFLALCLLVLEVSSLLESACGGILTPTHLFLSLLSPACGRVGASARPSQSGLGRSGGRTAPRAHRRRTGFKGVEPNHADPTVRKRTRLEC